MSLEVFYFLKLPILCGRTSPQKRSLTSSRSADLSVMVSFVVLCLSCFSLQAPLQPTLLFHAVSGCSASVFSFVEKLENKNCVFVRQDEGGRSGEALGSGDETVPSLPAGDRAAGGVRPVGLQRQGETSIFFFISRSSSSTITHPSSSSPWPLVFLRVRSWWGRKTARSSRSGRRTRRPTCCWTVTLGGESGVWALIQPKISASQPATTPPSACGTSPTRCIHTHVSDWSPGSESLGRRCWMLGWRRARNSRRCCRFA